MFGLKYSNQICNISFLDLMGAEGLSVESKSLNMEAGQDITLTSSTGSISLDGQVTLGTIHKWRCSKYENIA